MKLENDKLFELREYNNLTQKAAGEILGVRQQTYAEWEKGKKIIPLKHLVTLANFYNVSIDYLTGLSRNKKVFHTYKTLNKEEIGKREVYDTKASEQRTVSAVGGISQQLYEKILMQAAQRKMELEAQGKQVTLVREEPFTTAQDSVEYKVYLMIWKKKWGNRIVEVEHNF